MRSRYPHFLALLLMSLILQYPAGAQAELRPGDTLHFAEDVLPEPPGFSRGQSLVAWDYTRLLSPFVFEREIRAAGRYAELFDHTPEVYFSMANNTRIFVYTRQDEMWVSGYLFEFDGSTWLANCVDPQPFRVLVETDTEREFDGRITLAPVVDNGNGPVTRPNMVRIELTYSIQVIQDREGLLSLPAERFYCSPQTWDYFYAEAGASNAADIELPDVLISRVERKYWSDQLPVPVLIERLDQALKPVNVIYKARPYGKPIRESVSSEEDIYVYPNPSYGYVRFDFVNLDPGKYYLQIYNILGLKLRSYEININGDKTLPFDFTDLGKGTYIYRLIDSERNAIRSKRLVIYTP